MGDWQHCKATFKGLASKVVKQRDRPWCTGI